MHRGAVRVLAIALLLAVASATSVQRYCLMDWTASEKDVSHDCCDAGIGALPPGCCHADLTLGPKAILSGKALAAAPTAVPLAWSVRLSRHELAVSSSPSLRPAHGPPLSVLRI